MAAACKEYFLLLCLIAILPNTFAERAHSIESVVEQSQVTRMTHDDRAVLSTNIKKRDLRNAVRSRRSVETDAVCSDQEKTFLQSANRIDSFSHKYMFANETKSSVSLVWVGENTGKILVAVTEEEDYMMMMTLALPSNLYLSEDEGHTFTDITDHLATGVTIKKDNGLQKNPVLPNQVFVVVHGDDMTTTDLYVSLDGAASFQRHTLPFILSSDLVFHPDPAQGSRMLALEEHTRKLHLTQNGGQTWSVIPADTDDVMSFKWSTFSEESDMTVYLTVDPYLMKDFGRLEASYRNDLVRYDATTGHKEVLLKEVYTFGLQGKFLFASVHKENNDQERIMKVSTDRGATWNEVQLPSITEDRFYSILDMSEGQIFLHVDEPGDTGRGTLYTSDAMGIVFAESLTNHLYPNGRTDLTDFYKVRSMRGVYIASQLSADNSIHTVISYDRGGEWVSVRRPDGVPCKDETKGCFLQIHNMYSLKSGVHSSPPYSVEDATGVILVHGHVADALQTVDPDVFVTSDGGYTWRLALHGPHDYEIADQGGLLVAMAANSVNQQIIKFSTDEGRCWHEYLFTNDTFHVTRMLTEPGNKAMTVAIWGYGDEDRQWRVYVIDFAYVISRQCNDDDYEPWVAHSDAETRGDREPGCLLGTKETFQRLKPESWCSNGHAKELSRSTQDTCECTKADYECDYGYYRRPDTDQCVPDGLFKGPDVNICLRGHEEKLVQFGYHKIPGDQCSGGFVPQSDQRVDLTEHCAEGDKSLLELQEGLDVAEPSDGRKRAAVLTTIVLAGMIGSIVLLAFLVHKYKQLKTRAATYRYSMLQTDDAAAPDDYEKELAVHTSLYEDSSDDDTLGPSAVRIVGNGLSSSGDSARSPEPAVLAPAPAPAAPHTPTPPPTQASGRVSSTQPAPGSRQDAPKVKSYHDDSDDDMLE